MKTLRNFAPFTLAVASIVLAAFQFSQVYNSNEWKTPSEEMVSTWENHVQSLREAIPSDVYQAGYMDKSMLGEGSDSLDVNEFQLMQYSLAPILLKMGAGEPWIIGNFDRNTDFHPWLDSQEGRYEVQSFGFGLYLIHKVGE